MKLSEAISKWKRSITTNMAVEYVLTLRADINAFSDAAQALERENEKLRELVSSMMRFFEDGDWCTECDHARECDAQEQYEDDCLMRFVFRDRMRELGIEVRGK